MGIILKYAGPGVKASPAGGLPKRAPDIDSRAGRMILLAPDLG
jgi:hypothetical protein